MAIGAIWGEIWNVAVWNVAIWAQAAAEDDTTPDAFSFTDQSGVARSSTITSAAITVQGIDAPSAISVSGDASSLYDINGSGTFTADPGTVNSGDTVRARQTSSASYSTGTNTVITIGGVSDTFTSITIPDPTATAKTGGLALRIGIALR